MEVKNCVLVVFGMILLFIREGLSLNCYQCDSTTHPDCKEYFDHNHMDTITIKSYECSVDASSHCIKTTGVWGGVVGTQRFCSSRDMGNQCQFIRYPDHDRIYRACIYTCSDDHCNGATGLSHSVQLLALLTVSITLILSLRR